MDDWWYRTAISRRPSCDASLFSAIGAASAGFAPINPEENWLFSGQSATAEPGLPLS